MNFKWHLVMAEDGVVHQAAFICKDGSHFWFLVQFSSCKCSGCRRSESRRLEDLNLPKFLYEQWSCHPFSARNIICEIPDPYEV